MEKTVLSFTGRRAFAPIEIDKVHPARALLLKRLRSLDGILRHLLRRGVIALEQADAFAVLEVDRPVK